ncbi:sulfur carrier protein ThiS [Pikeienuella sp. HZG-20]|uniref:sulfur carrier protein ThiS n=1 Tax=Paludibacillus litoralis TaxID=3133267 RepID=UPI0030EC3D5A
MMIDVNGAPREIDAATLDIALEQLGWGGARVATALNGRFIPASARPDTPVAEGDRLEVLAAMQGG